jgi:hypothetical protein
MAAVHVGTPPFALSRGRLCGMPLPRENQLVLDAWNLGDILQP